MLKKICKILFWCTIILSCYLGTLYFFQNRLLFFPETKYISPQDANLPMFHEEIIKTEDGTSLMSWYHQGLENMPAVLFLHGNAGQIARFAPHLVPIAQSGYSVLALEYRGFGNTPGTISQKTIFQDVAAAFDYLKAKGHNKIIVYGYSFGAAFACGLTSLRTPNGLILTAPFSSLDKVVAEKPVPLARFALKDKYKSFEYLKKYHNPLLIIHGKKDRLIGAHHAKILLENAASAQKQAIILDDETHFSVFFKEKNMPLVLQFLEQF